MSKVTPEEIRTWKSNVFAAPDLSEFVESQTRAEDIILVGLTMNATLEYVAREMEQEAPSSAEKFVSACADCLNPEELWDFVQNNWEKEVLPQHKEKPDE